MELLNCTDLSTFFKNYAILLSAVITFIGVGIAAFFSYRSNIKTNKSNICIEECKLRYAFMKERFDALIELSQEMKKTETIPTFKNKSDEKIITDFINAVNSQVTTYEKLFPFIAQDQFNEFKPKLKEIKLFVASLVAAISNGTGISDTHKSQAKVIQYLVYTVSIKCTDIINNELIALGESLQSFKIA